MNAGSSRLLLDEQPLQVLPSLAAAIGVNAAILLQQINYWIKHAEKAKDARKHKAGKWWTYNTYAEWREQMPWLSESGIRKLVKELREQGLIATVKHGPKGRDHTLWYTINYDAVNALPATLEVGENHVSLSDTSICHSGAPHVSESDVSSKTESPESLSEIPTGGGQSPSDEASESLANNVMRDIYNAMKAAGFTITGKNKETKKNEYGRQVGRVQWMLDNMEPTDAELEELPETYVQAFKIRGAATDAVYAMNEVRRQPERQRIITDSKNTGPPPWEPINPHGERAPRKMSAENQRMAEENAALERELLKGIA